MGSSTSGSAEDAGAAAAAAVSPPPPPPAPSSDVLDSLKSVVDDFFFLKRKPKGFCFFSGEGGGESSFKAVDGSGAKCKSSRRGAPRITSCGDDGEEGAAPEGGSNELEAAAAAPSGGGSVGIATEVPTGEEPRGDRGFRGGRDEEGW